MQLSQDFSNGRHDMLIGNVLTTLLDAILGNNAGGLKSIINENQGVMRISGRARACGARLRAAAFDLVGTNSAWRAAPFHFAIDATNDDMVLAEVA